MFATQTRYRSSTCRRGSISSCVALSISSAIFGAAAQHCAPPHLDFHFRTSPQRRGSRCNCLRATCVSVPQELVEAARAPAFLSIAHAADSGPWFYRAPSPALLVVRRPPALLSLRPAPQLGALDSKCFFRRSVSCYALPAASVRLLPPRPHGLIFVSARAALPTISFFIL